MKTKTILKAAALFVATIAVTGCAATPGQDDNFIKPSVENFAGSAFIYDPDLPPVYATEFIYSDNFPPVRGSAFLREPAPNSNGK